jgi:hypothetical protein
MPPARSRWTSFVADRETRQWVVAQARRQLDAARVAYTRLYGGADASRGAS